jgi:hypothetical protein
MDFDAASRKRDAHARHRMLRLLFAARDVEAGINGRLLQRTLDEAAAPADVLESDGHAVRLLKDLAAAGYAELHDRREYRRQAYGLDWLDAAITAKGVRFCEGGEPADPLVDDGRIVKGARP